MPKVAVIANPISGAKVKNNGGTVVMGGNVSTNSPITNAPFATITEVHPGHVGAAIPHALVQGDLTNKTASFHNCGRWQPYQATGATYGVMNQSQYLIRRYHLYTAGVSNSYLNSGCSDFGARNAIHRQQRGRYSVMYQINIAFGQAGALPGGTNSDTFSYDNGVSVWATDKEGAVTRAVPGYLVYRTASTAFTTKQYPAPNT